MAIKKSSYTLILPISKHLAMQSAVLQKQLTLKLATVAPLLEAVQVVGGKVWGLESHCTSCCSAQATLLSRVPPAV